MPLNPPKGLAEVSETAKDLLSSLVEADRGRPRAPFVVVSTNQGTLIVRSGMPDTIATYRSDINELAEVAAIRIDPHRGGDTNFDLTPAAHRWYLDHKSRDGVVQVETEVVRFLTADRFSQAYPDAYAKWSAANRALWSGNAESRLTAIGHDCREALQSFATQLVTAYRPANAPAEPIKDQKRLMAVIDQQRPTLGKSRAAFLSALVEYWARTSDLVQRQEHGDQKEGGPISWEDARRVVFHTALVMYEVDRALH